MIKEYRNKKIQLAHDYFKEIVYQSANLENENITYVDTLNTLDFFEDAIKTIPYDKVVIITSLKRAYEYVIYRANSNKPITYKDALKINEIIDSYERRDAGCFRNHRVLITGTGYIPKVYTEQESIQILNEFKKIKTFADGARLCAYWSKIQLFPNGNKRTALCFANLCLIANNLNFIQIGNRAIYSKALVDYYNDETKLQTYIKYLTKASSLAITNRISYKDLLTTINSLSKHEQDTLSLISKNNKITAKQLGQNLGLSERQTQRILASLTRKGNIVRVGSNKKGSWKILSKIKTL